MKKLRFPILLACFLFLAMIAAPLLSAPKEAKKPDLKGFSEQVTRLVSDWKVPGLAISIVKDGKIIFAEGFGQLGREAAGAIVAPLPAGEGRESVPGSGLAFFFDDDEIGLQAARFRQAQIMDGEKGAGGSPADNNDRVVLFELHG